MRRHRTTKGVSMTRSVLAMLVLTTVACGGRAPASPTIPSTSPTIPSTQAAPTFTLSGLIFENRAGAKQPVGGVNVNLWGVPCGTAITTPPGIPPGATNCTTWYSTITGNHLVSDAQGRFVAPDVPGSVVNIIPFKEGYVQPCDIIVGIH